MNLIDKIKKVFLNNQADKDVSIYTGASDLLEIQYGHSKSKIIGESIDAQENPIPWFTYPAIDYINQIDLRDKNMLEWGSGNSSRYFADKVQQLYSVEHNKDWYKKILNLKLKNHTIQHAENNYVEEPVQFSTLFDLILIDGIQRESCARMALKLLKSGGLIILDNSDRHPDIAKLYRANDFIEVDFHGLGPINDYTWTTSFFFDRSVNLRPIALQPVIPIGGGF